MKQLKYLNGVLTVIATCLVIITLVLTHAIPTASAQTRNSQFDKIKVLEDGSILVHVFQDWRSTPLKVNVEEIRGMKLDGRAFPVLVLPNK